MRRSKHSLSHFRLLTEDMGYLMPIGVVEVLPGDTFRHQTSMLIRMASLVTPVMHPVHAKIHHWYVPNRLLWDNFEDFITNKDPELSLPTVTVPALPGSQMLDHMGVDPAAVGAEINALPIRAYNKIWNEFYRDQDLQTELAEDQLDMQFAAWEKDYFTTARLTPQQGPGISVPFETGAAPVASAGNIGDTVPIVQADGVTRQLLDAEGTTVKLAAGQGAAGAALYADLSQATAGIAVEDMRQAFALQRFAEARSRFGSRYVDYLRFLGIKPSDGRLDRPEYLGGGKQTLSFSEVLSTADTTDSVVGDYAGHGIGALTTRPYRRFFEEHGFVISLAVVRPKAVYAQSLNRSWLRRTYEDFWQKENEALGQQPVAKQEVYAPSLDSSLFGYVDRYLEYRGNPSFVSGTFRDSTDDSWHLARVFTQAPELNASFVQCEPTNRIFADTGIKQMYMMVQHRIAARRLVARRSRN